MNYFESRKYEILPTETYKVIRSCSGCGNKSVYCSTNKIRVNVNGKLIDVWLIYQCEKCKHTYNLRVYSRVNRNKVDKLEYEALLKNNREIVNQYCLDRNIVQKSAATIFGEPNYVLKDAGISTKENTIHFFNPYKVKVRHDKLIAECLQISRSQAQKLLETGALKVSKLSNNEVIFSY